MTEDERPACLICGQRFRSVGHHVVRAHDISLTEYRDQHGIRRGAPLTAPSSRAAFQESIGRRIEAGEFAEHFAGNAALAVTGARAAAQAKRVIRAAGVDLPPGTPATPRSVIEAIVAAIEAGALVATAVKRSPIGHSAFHEGLKRHPDLRARADEARRRRRAKR